MLGAMTPWNLRDRVRRLPAGEVIVHTAVFLLGAAFIVLGFALVVLPGPLTIPPILLGLVIWSLEFEFAERWLDPFERKAQEAWEAAKLRPWRTGLVAGGGLVAAVVLVVLALSFDVLGAVT
jgi:hypothetical protein